ncbi:MAG: hypothetical protein ACRDPQ_07505 [Nocardioidaceae bacterium]
MSGWTWGEAAGIGLTWVRADSRGSGLGTTLLDAFEAEACKRGRAGSSSPRSRSKRPGSTRSTATARSSAGTACPPTARRTSTSARISSGPQSR